MKLNKLSTCLAVVSSLAVLDVVVSVQVCTNVRLLAEDVQVNSSDGQTLPPDNSSLGYQEPAFAALSSSSLMQCAKQCQLRSRCESFTFTLTSGQCQLFSTLLLNTTHRYDNIDDVHAGNIRSWPSRLAGDCENHTCPQNTVCEGNMNCLITHCVNAPSIQNGRVSLTRSNQTFFDIGKVEFTCDIGYRPQYTLSCLSDGSWSVPTCIAITNCKGVRLCNSSYGNGEYWILLKAKNYTLAKIYCNNMASSYPNHFVTLLEDNYSQSPTECPSRCGRTAYAKLAIVITSLRILRKINTFTTGTCGIANFGSTTSCAANASNSTSCGQSGTFRIDLRGTGFRMRPGTLWRSGGEATVVVTHSDKWTVVNLACNADSACKQCMPMENQQGKFYLFLEVDETSNPVMGSATVPRCSYSDQYKK